MAFKTVKLQVTTTGSAGSAAGTATATSPISGIIHAIYVKYTSQPATTDTTIATTGSVAPARTLLTLTNTNTSGWVDLANQLKDSAGAAISAQYGRVPIDDYLTVTVAQGDAVTNGVEVYVLVQI